MVLETPVKMQCEDCKEELVNKGYEVYCPKCGLVAEDQFVDMGREYVEKDFSTLVAKGRTGPPVSYLNPFGSTIIGKKISTPNSKR